MDRNKLHSKIKKLQLVSHKLVETLLAGNYRSVFKGPGIEFNDVREYVQGDEARLIDWNVSSRLGSPFTKTFKEEREMILFLIVDLSSSIMSGSGGHSRRDTVSLLFSLLSFAAVQNNDKIGAVFFSDRIEGYVPPRKGKKHALRLIQDMLEFKPEGKGSDLGMALRASGEGLKRRGICVILSDFKTTGYHRDLSLLGKKHDVIAIRVSDPVEQRYPKSGLVRLEDPETGDVIWGNGNSKKFRHEFTEFWQLQQRKWERECRRRGVSTIDISTDEDPAFKLIQFFNRRKR